MTTKTIISVQDSCTTYFSLLSLSTTFLTPNDRVKETWRPQYFIEMRITGTETPKLRLPQPVKNRPQLCLNSPLVLSGTPFLFLTPRSSVIKNNTQKGLNHSKRCDDFHQESQSYYCHSHTTNTSTSVPFLQSTYFLIYRAQEMWSESPPHT